MKLQAAIEILEYHQEWRLGKKEDMIHEPKELTEALDVVLSEVKKFHSGAVKRCGLSINQKVKRNYPESWDYWVSEIQGEDVLIRTTENEDDPKYDDFWVNVAELRLV